jgi:phage-related protein
MELQKLYVTLALQADQYRQGLEDAGRQAEGLRSRIGGALGTAGRVATGALLGIGAAAVAGFGLAMNSAISMNASLEQSTMQFTTLMGDADMAADHVAMLFELGAKTPFETEPIIQASKHLQVFGGAALNTEENLILIGDAAAAVGAPFDEVAFWTGRMYSAIQGGQPFGEAAARLQELGLLTPEVRQQMEGLQQSGADVNEVWGAMEGQLGTFTGAMEMQAGSWAGITSTLSDTLQMLAANALAPFFELAKNAVQGFSDLLNSPAIQEGIAALAEKLTAIIQNVAEFIQEFGRGMEVLGNPVLALGEALDNFIPEETMTRVWDFLLGIDSLIQPVINAVTQFVSWKDVLAALAVVIGVALAPVIAGIIGAVVAVAAPILAVIAVVALLRNAWENDWGGIQGKVQAVIDFVVPLVQNGLGAIQAWWETNGASILAKAQEIFGGIQATVQRVIGAVIGWWNTNWPSIQGTIETVWGIVQTVIQTAIDIIGPALGTLMDNGKSALGGLSGLVEPLQGLWAKVGPFVQAAATVIGGILTGLLGLIVGIVKGVSEAIDPFIKTFINLAENIVRIVGGILETLTGVFNLIVGLVTGNSELIEKAWEQLSSGVKDIVGGLVDGVVDLISGLWDTLTTLVGGLVDGVIEFFTDLYDRMVGHSIVVDLVEDVRAWFETMLEWIGEVLVNLWTVVSDPFLTMWEELKLWFLAKADEIKGIGSALIGGLKAGIEAGLDELRSILQSVADAIPDWLMEFLGIHSPARATIPVGQAIVEGLIAGIELTGDELAEAIEEWIVDPSLQMLHQWSEMLAAGDMAEGLASGFAGHFERMVMEPMEEQMDSLTEKVAAAGVVYGQSFEGMAVADFVDDGSMKTLDQLMLVRSRLASQINDFKMRGVDPSAWAFQLQGLDTVDQAIDAFRLRNDINAEYIRQQEKLFALEKARADLDFLKQQMELLGLMKANNIPLSALDGVTLGLGADPGQLMGIMVGVMETIVRQTEHEMNNAFNQSPAVSSTTPGVEGQGQTMNVQTQNINGGQHIYVSDAAEGWLEQVEVLAR